MAERKSGPVKPPVIDLTARPAGDAKPDAGKPEAKTAEKPKPTEPPKPAAAFKPAEPPKPGEAMRPTSPPKPSPPAPGRWAPAIAGGIGGAVLATAICYGLAYAGLWPSNTGDTSARLDQLGQRLAQSEKTGAGNVTALADLNTHLAGLETDFAAKLAAASSALDQVKASVAKAQPAADLAPVMTQLKTLSGRLDAIAAGASSADAGAIAANLTSVQKGLSDLSDRLATLDTRAGATDTALTSLKSGLDSAQAAIAAAAKAPSAAAIATTMQLPLLLSVLEADFTAGRPFAADLRNLQAALPDTKIPASVASAATTGLPQPDVLAQHFEAVLPDILAARPTTGDTGWQSQVTDWVKNTLALRPAGEAEGTSSEAIASRLEGAVNRHDFPAATKLLGQLPAPMQTAAGDTASGIAALADAGALIADLRAKALTPQAGAGK
jgi:hypothetical protein